jgi:hypothetical protein
VYLELATIKILKDGANPFTLIYIWTLQCVCRKLTVDGMFGGNSSILLVLWRQSSKQASSGFEATRTSQSVVNVSHIRIQLINPLTIYSRHLYRDLKSNPTLFDWVHSKCVEGFKRKSCALSVK